MGGILTGSNTPPTFSVSFECMWVCMSFLFVQLVPKKKEVFWRLPFRKKRQVILSLPLNAAEIYEIEKLATLWSR